MKTDEYAAIIRSMIEHENSLMNHRMTWMWTSQGLLVTATGIMWEIHIFLILLVCLFGFCSSISLGISCNSALRAIKSLRIDWGERKKEDPEYRGPRVIGSPEMRPFISKLFPWNFLPWLMALIWICIAVARFILVENPA